MKNLLSTTLALTFAFSLFSINSNAQSPVINKNNFPAIGKKNNYFLADTTNINQGAAGQNVTWNFSNLQDMEGADSIYEEYLDALSTPFIDDFPDANVAVEDGSSYSYYQVSDDTVKFLGMATSDSRILQAYSDPELRLTLPFAYKDSLQDTYYTEYRNSGFDFVRKGTSTVTADAYGTLILPNKTYSNVIRVHIYRQNQDSADIAGLWLNRHEYHYINGNTQETLLKITLNEVDSSFGNVRFSQDAKIIAVNRTATTSVFNTEISKSTFTIYPNPAKEIVQVEFESKASSNNLVTIYNQLGQEIKTVCGNGIVHGKNSIPVTISELPAGLYYIQLQSGETLMTQKLIVE